MIPSRCDSPSPLRRAAHLGLVCPYSLGDAQYLGRITQHYRQCREATVLQIVHRERPAVLYPQASRSPHTESGYRLYRYPIMSIGMHLQCRVQLQAPSQYPIATLNLHFARSHSVGTASLAAFAASRDVLSMIRVSSTAVSTQRRPRRVFITS